ncbi:MAG: hypothetical protein M3R00_10235, partial [Pseudomonadota bacterium]|nr:hypothetical protein [Pseudomonadota bacterium]
MRKLQEIVNAEVSLANCLLGSMNEKLLWVTPEKQATVHTVMYAMAYEIFAAFNIKPSYELVNLTADRQLKSFKLFDTNHNTHGYNPIRTIPLPRCRTSAQHLNDSIAAAVIREEIRTLLTEDEATLVPIVLDLLKIIAEFLAVEEQRSL